MTDPVLDFAHITHAFLGRDVLRDISLAVMQGEVVALIGPSGCGKSTLVHLAAGLLEQKSGRISRRFARPARGFQEPRLMPWATAEANIAYAARLAGMGRRAAVAAAREAAARVHFDASDLGK